VLIACSRPEYAPRHPETLRHLRACGFDPMTLWAVPRSRLRPTLRAECGIMIAAGTTSLLLAHYATWQMCATLGRPLFVFEDDAYALVSEPAERVRLSLRALIRSEPELPDIVYWGPTIGRRYTRTTADGLFSVCTGERLPVGLHAHLLFPAGARKILEHTDMVDKADIEIIVAARRCGLRAYSHVKPVFTQRQLMREFAGRAPWLPERHATDETPVI
jgi:hypothetical protein